MTYVIRVPPMVIDGATARIEALHVRVGDRLRRGTPLFDFSVDLGQIVGHLCPPVAFHKAVAQEEGLVLSLAAELGAVFEANAELGRIGRSADDSLDAEPTRGFRIVVAGISWNPEMWSGGGTA